MPDFTPIYSSWIDGIAYDPDTQELHVKHSRDDSITTYQGVPEDLYASIRKSPSIGSAIHSSVRDVFPHVTLK